MKWKSTLARPYARRVARTEQRNAKYALIEQERVFKNLVTQGEQTAFGRDHDFENINNYRQFKARVPVRDYEALRPYVDRIIAGEEDVLWPGRPKYFAKTSGTTSGVKYIPLTKESLPNHFGTAKNALMQYSVETGNFDWLDGKLIFLSGSPELTEKGGIPTGRLSGISNHLIPGIIKSGQVPSYRTNCIEDWETKLEAIVDETVGQDLRLISGIPPWVQMYFERLLERTGKSTVLEVFPNFSVFAYGGVNYEPYRPALEQLIGRRIDSVETYPASEGFIAYQDRQSDPALVLNVASGIFFEFIPADEFFNERPTRLSLADVEIGINYALVLNSTAGLWGYSIGDTVRFTSVDPPRLLVTGRIKHFISAFGEHVIGKEVETALREVAATHSAEVTEFTVAPQIAPPEGGTPYHEWFVEFGKAPQNLLQFAADLDASMVRQNIYYKDLIEGKVLQPLKIRTLPAGSFRSYLKSQGKLGGQNKMPRLSNDRKIADALG